MNTNAWILVGLSAFAACWGLGLWFNRRGVRRYDGRGDPSHGIVIFVEPVRWLFIVWGFSSFCRGLRRSGYRGRTHLFRWCTTAGALLVVPDLARRKRLHARAEELAGMIQSLAAAHPRSAIDLAGYSSGCYIALEACRRIQSPQTVRQVVLLAGATSPAYRLETLAGSVRRIYTFHSAIDVITGLGPLVFGSNDRRWGPACGTVGFRCRWPFVVQRGWRPADVRHGYLGDHFSVTSSRFVAARIAPLLRD
jgi:hypothetical protein